MGGKRAFEVLQMNILLGGWHVRGCVPGREMQIESERDVEAQDYFLVGVPEKIHI